MPVLELTEKQKCALWFDLQASLTPVVLEVTDEQVMELIEHLPKKQKEVILSRLAEKEQTRPSPRFGSAKNDILYMASDFDAPLDDFQEYM